MSNLVRCIRCKKAMTDEEFGAHDCNPPTTYHKQIDIVFYQEGEDEIGQPFIIAKGYDGTLYTLTKVRLIAADKITMTPDESYDPNDSERGGNPNGNPTEPDCGRKPDHTGHY